MLLVIEDDPAPRAHPPGPGPRQGLQGDRGHARARPASPWPGSSAPTPSRWTSTCPTCWAGRCSTTSSPTRPRGTSRCKSSRSTRSARSALAHGAFSYLVKSPTTEGIEAALRPPQRLHRPAHQAAPGRRGQRHRASVDRRAARPRRHRADGRRHRRARRSRPCSTRPLRLRRARPAPARHERLRAAGEVSGGAGLARSARRRLHRQGALRRRRDAAQDAWPRASSSKTFSRPSGSWTRPRCSSTASSPTCRETSRQMLERLHGSNEILHGRKVLVVDDDARNIFALTSLLERHGIEVISATNGRQAIDLIQKHARPEHGSHGYHDAGNGRLPDHGRNPQGPPSSAPCRCWPSPPRR